MLQESVGLYESFGRIAAQTPCLKLGPKRRHEHKDPTHQGIWYPRCLGPLKQNVGALRCYAYVVSGAPFQAPSPSIVDFGDTSWPQPSPEPSVGGLSSWTRKLLQEGFTWRLLCSSFLVMTCLIATDHNIPPKRELHRSLQVCKSTCKYQKLEVLRERWLDKPHLARQCRISSEEPYVHP